MVSYFTATALHCTESLVNQYLIVPCLAVAISPTPDEQTCVDRNSTVASAGTRQCILQCFHRQRLPCHCVYITAEARLLEQTTAKIKNAVYLLPFFTLLMLNIRIDINNNKQQQPFNGRLSGTTRVGRYQKKHSPAHTHPGQRTSFITFLFQSVGQ